MIMVLFSTIKYVREMLMTTLKTLVKNLVKESFDITFMRNKKSIKTLIDFFFFSHKNFFLIGFLTNVLRAFVSTTLLNEATKKVSPNRLIF